jgi:hypothetical protein
MDILLKALAIGCSNAIRGHGLNGGKVLTVLIMGIAAYFTTYSYIFAVLFPLPLCLSWWWSGGTGRYMPWVIAHLQWLPLSSDSWRWRFFEFTAPFVYSYLVLTVAKYITLTNY